MASDLNVLVVGAGPTGLLLAAELNRRGVECGVIDSHTAPLHWDRATVLHPRSLEVFESLGILEPLLTVGVKQHMVRIHSAGNVLGEIDFSNCGSRYGFNLGVSEEVTESILTKYLHQQGGKVIRSSKLVELEDGEGGLVATIQRDSEIERVSVQWVVGCDGYHSSTRKMSGIEMAGHDIAESWAVFDVTLVDWPESYEAIYSYLDEVPVILTPLPQRRWRVYVRPSSSQSDLVADALSTIKRYHSTIGFEDVTNPTRFQCQSKVANRYRSGFVLLAGDAAHVCSPAEGHGMNSGLQDAFNLVWKLALVCQGHCSPVLLDSYEAERQPVAEMIVASGDAAERLQIERNRAERRARDETLRTVFTDPTSRHHESVAEAELDIDYSGSPIVMGNLNEALAPGQRLPDTIEISLASGETRMLHELTFRAGHTALILGGLSIGSSKLSELDRSIRAGRDASIIEETVALSARPENRNPGARIAPAASERLGIGEVTLLIVRPDGHVGLRADHDHLEALKTYQALLVSGRT